MKHDRGAWLAWTGYGSPRLHQVCHYFSLQLPDLATTTTTTVAQQWWHRWRKDYLVHPLGTHSSAAETSSLAA